MFVTGPPTSGKSHYSGLLSKYYNIPHVVIQDAVALAATVQGEMGEELRAKIEEAKDAMMEEAEKNKKKGQEITRDQLQVRIEDKYLFQLMQLKLQDNACRNRGFILDGYPRTFKDAQNVFLTKPPRPEEEEEPPEELEEGQEKSWEGYIINQAIAP